MSTQVDEIVGSPTSHFKSPGEVLNDSTLSTKDKRRVLESWKLDAQRLNESTAENMSGGEESDLRAVSRALLTLTDVTDSAVINPPMNGAPVARGMALGSVLGAGIGLIATAATATASLALIAQTAVAGLIVGGVVGAFKRPLR